jgi:hypothetical protein
MFHLRLGEETVLFSFESGSHAEAARHVLADGWYHSSRCYRRMDLLADAAAESSRAAGVCRPACSHTGSDVKI